MPVDSEVPHQEETSGVQCYNQLIINRLRIDVRVKKTGDAAESAGEK